MTLKHTHRGFPYLEFSDKYGTKCSIQLSSLADDRCVWVGPNDGNRMHINQAQAKQIANILLQFAESGELENL